MGCLVAGTIVCVALVLLALAVCGTVISLGEMGGQFSLSSTRRQGGEEYSELMEVWVSGDGKAKVARININGVILLGNGRYSGPLDLALGSIRRATHDPDVRGLILEIDSPGGGITASDIFYNALVEFKRTDYNRRVVVLMNDLAASGAYYIACAADEIIAHPTSLTGSIGVIMQSYNISELAKTIGVSDVTIKSGENKDLLNPFQPVDRQQLRELIQPIVDNMHARFVDIVSEGRNLPIETVRPLADGRLFDAKTARDNNLINSIGYRQDAELRMAEILGDSITIIRYEELLNFASLFRQSFLRFQGDASLGATLKNMLETPDTKFMYLWRP